MHLHRLAATCWLFLLACGDATTTITFDAGTDSATDVALDPLPDAQSDAAPELDAPLDVGPVDELIALPAPPHPTPPGEVGILTVTVRTGAAAAAGTDDGVAFCVNDSDCFGLNVPDIDDREVGQTDVFHLRDTGLSRRQIMNATLRTTSTEANNDRWTPACLDVRVDGEPVHCNDTIPVHIGTGTSQNEVRSWTDPAGLAQQCVSCAGDTITHGPLIGPPTDSSLRIWVRTDATRLTGLRLGHTPDLVDAPVVAWAWPKAEDDFTADLLVDGLKPDTEYFYRIEVDGALSQPIRSIQTAPAPGQAKPFRFAFGSCSRVPEQPIFEAIRASNPDVFLFVGDNNYANTRYRDALRWHYRNFRGLNDRAGLVANTPSLATWDDHDFLANNSNSTCLDRDEALSAFKEYWSNPMYGLENAPGAYFSTQYGAVDFFVIDCRMYRPDVGDDAKRCEVDPNAQDLPRTDGPLGPAQESWLFDGLQNSDATFKFVACGSRFTPEGSLDSWAAFPEASQRLSDLISSQNVEGVVFLSGDIHRSLFTAFPTATYDVPEIVSSPLANSNSECGTADPEQRACYDAGNSWVQIDIDPDLADPTLTAKILDESGSERATWTIKRSDLK